MLMRRLPPLLAAATAAAAATALCLTALTAPASAQTHQGRTYYVSSTGSAANPGTAAAPFPHIQQCAAIMVAGDSCQIATGTYRETVTPAHSGTAGAPITYKAAPGADVTIDGTDPVTGWSQVTGTDLSGLEAGDGFLAGSPFASAVGSGDIYQATVTLNPDLPGDQVFVDGAMDTEAQWPYPGDNPLAPAEASAQSGTNTSLSDTALTQPAGYWDGARLTARNWFITETGTVTDSSVGSVTAASFTGCVSLSPNQVTSYFLSGRLETLGHSGEWFYQASSHTLYAWMTDGDSPANHTVEAKQRNLGIDLAGISYTNVTGLGVRATAVQTSAASTHDVISGLTATYVSAYDDLSQDPNMVTAPDGCAFLSAGETTSGIVLDGTDNTLRDSTVDWSAGNGVVVTGSHNTVTDDSIYDVDYMGSYAAGVNIIGSDQTVTHNTVAGAGRSDVDIDNKVTGAASPGDEIGYNDLSGFNSLVTDGGAIYVCCNENLATTVMDHNLLHDPAPLGGSTLAPGIYLDNDTYNATVEDNVAYSGINNGVVLFNGDSSSGDQVYNNTEGNDPQVVSLWGSTYTSTQIYNNIGNVSANPGATEKDNLPFSTDPQFTSPATLDYTLQAGSPARTGGVVVPPATDGYTGRSPSLGAYQYGAPKWTGGSNLAQTTVQAARYGDNSGVATHLVNGQEVLGNFDGGDWAEYAGIDFGSGRDMFVGQLGEDPNYAGRQFQIRIDSLTGPVIGTVTALNTGGFDTYILQATPIVPTKGVHDVYLVALGSSPGVSNLKSFSFTQPASNS